MVASHDVRLCVSLPQRGQAEAEKDSRCATPHFLYTSWVLCQNNVNLTQGTTNMYIWEYFDHTAISSSGALSKLFFRKCL